MDKQVTVYYDPEEPQMAALYPRQLPSEVWIAGLPRSLRRCLMARDGLVVRVA
ncbi:MAG: hypothetical protein ACNA8W_21460 [Bradymonadaceae bacterium]